MPPFLPRKRLRSISPGDEAESSTPTSSAKAKGKGKAAAAPPRKKTLFDDLDAGMHSTCPERSKKLLEKLGAEDDDSELSSLGSSEPEFEDVTSARRRKTALGEESEEDDDDDDDEVEFEDVPSHSGPSTAAPSVSAAPALSGGDLDLTLTRETRISLVNPHNKKQGPSKIERGIRVATHQMHVQFLVWHNSVRNRWCCDKEVQEVLVEEVKKMTSFEKDIKRWRRDSGLDVEEEEEGEGSMEAGKGKGKGKATDGKRNEGMGKKDERNHRDWGSPAKRTTTGKINMSHGDPLFTLLNRLSSFWKQRFTITAPGLHKIGYMSLPRIDDEIKSNKSAYDFERHGERIEDKEAFKELAKQCEGSRDVGAQLFTALLRGLGLEARMVASMQPVGFGWSKNEEAVERKEKKAKPKDEDPESSDEEESEEEVKPTPKGKAAAKGKQKADPKKPAKATSKQKAPNTRTRGRGAKDTPIDLSESEDNTDDEDDDNESVIDITPSRPPKKPSKNYEKDLAPNYWVEVLSPVTNTWVPVNPFAPSDPVTTNPELLLRFEPRGAKAEKAKQVMCYIVGFSSDGTAKDVTVRYLKRHMWPGKTKGVRIPVEKVPVYNSRGKVKRYEEYDWFKTVMSGYERPGNQRTFVDDQEEATDLKAVKPEKKEVKEGEETLQSYKQSAEFVLERHLRREEALLPTANPVKMFTVKGKGDAAAAEEKVYLRKDVVNCKSVETWHKEGRAPKVGEQPLKRVPYRAATTNRKRELAEAELASGGKKMLQGLYSREQTDWIIPPPIENGVIPKNGFGNMDCYVPSMVPQGAVHIPLRGMKRICNKLGIDFAEAVTGFEFGARMAIPIITGVVVAEENEEMVMEQWRAYEAERLRKEDEKRTKAALGMWRKMLMGMRIIERVREEYGDLADENPDVLNPWTNKSTMAKKGNAEDEATRRIVEQNEEDMAGGFFPEGHEEEEAPQSFFPTRHEDSDEEDGGGFIMDEDESAKKGKGPASESYLTPISMPSNAKVEAIAADENDADEEAESISKPATRATRKTAAKPASATTATATRKRKAVVDADAEEQVTPAKRASNAAPRGRGRPGKVIPPGDDDDGDDALSDMPSADLRRDDGGGDEDEHGEPVAKTKTPASRRKGRGAGLAEERPATRTLPKRRATRRSTGVRSRYFEGGGDGDGDGE